MPTALTARLLAGLATAAALGLAACDTVPLLAPTDSTITLSASSERVPLGGSVTLTAHVLEAAGTAVHDGTAVRFTTSLGTIAPETALTVGGVATATLSAGSVSGVATVRAVSGAASGTAPDGSSATNSIDISIGAAAADAVTLTATPTSVASTGGTTTLTAIVLDESGNGLPGLPVIFSTTAGTLSAVSATTDAAGRAVVTLTTAAEATVTASIGSSAGTSSASLTVEVAVPGTVTLQCQGSGSTAATNCSQAVDAAVRFTAARGTTAGAAAIVSATLDFGDGETASLGSLSSPGTLTHVYSTIGNYTAVLRATDANGEQTQASNAVTIVAKTPFGVTIASSTTAVVANTTSVTFTATLTGDTTVGITSYVWTFLAGSTTEATVTTSGNTVGHVFTSTGVKTIRVVATATDGRTASGEFQVNVS